MLPSGTLAGSVKRRSFLSMVKGYVLEYSQPKVSVMLSSLIAFQLALGVCCPEAAPPPLDIAPRGRLKEPSVEAPEGIEPGDDAPQSKLRLCRLSSSLGKIGSGYELAVHTAEPAAAAPPSEEYGCSGTSRRSLKAKGLRFGGFRNNGIRCCEGGLSRPPGKTGQGFARIGSRQILHGMS